MELDDLLLDGTLGDETVDGDWILLSDAVSTVRGRSPMTTMLCEKASSTFVSLSLASSGKMPMELSNFRLSCCLPVIFTTLSSCGVSS